MLQMRLVLASASPRRRELLRGLDLVFSVSPADIDETPMSEEAPAHYVERLAQQKAQALAAVGTTVIAADTVVVFDGEILGKPKDREHAVKILSRLANRTHEVATGVAVIAISPDGERREISSVETTKVTFGEITPRQLDSFLDGGEYADKAGSYALLGASSIFADHVEGSVSNVVGLPLPLLDRLCSQIDIDLLSFKLDSPNQCGTRL
ncbi:MAG: septum formation protein Maf [Acidimicrobiaceae bacterium]|nr:Maf family protein [Acidimicrobiaceae bacterium]MXW60719.1 septum formation protein Maf [Acidimicrobiaceae bacterium]MXW75242.1 septum formation protein Maf [Acidimicrobiaceae bacterium]MYA74045.1 septum formation protein Maf [Acidimicrobiaceae bacterium]MYC42339.1 septum formation protein Maf [Acidimicrobiaceae bacterium]